MAKNNGTIVHHDERSRRLTLMFGNVVSPKSAREQAERRLKKRNRYIQVLETTFTWTDSQHKKVCAVTLRYA